MKRDPLSELTREILAGKTSAMHRKKLIDKIAQIVYAYPKKHLGWDEDDVGETARRGGSPSLRDRGRREGEQAQDRQDANRHGRPRFLSVGP